MPTTGAVTPRGSHVRSILAAALTLVPVLLVAWTANAWVDHLPDPLPTHWTDTSVPDGFSSYVGTWRTILVVTIVAAAVSAVGAALAWVKPLFERATTGLGAAVGFGALGLWFSLAHAAWNRADARDAPLGWGLALPIVFGILGVLITTLVIGPRPRTVHTGRLADRPTSGLVLAPGEDASWSHRTFVVWPLAFAGLMAVLTIVFGFVAGPPAALVLGLAALTVAGLAWVQVTVDRRGLRLGLGPWGWTVKKIPVDAIAQVNAESIKAMDWGGWGYRVMPGRSALVLGSGPAIVVDLDDGRRFAVTVPDPEPAVDLLRALAARTENPVQ